MSEQIYGLASDIFQDETGLWGVEVLWVNEEGDMGRGTVNLPNYTAGDILQKYFRKNVDPLGPEQLQKIIDTAIRGIPQ